MSVNIHHFNRAFVKNGSFCDCILDKMQCLNCNTSNVIIYFCKICKAYTCENCWKTHASNSNKKHLLKIMEAPLIKSWDEIFGHEETSSSSPTSDDDSGSLSSLSLSDTDSSSLTDEAGALPRMAKPSELAKLPDIPTHCDDHDKILSNFCMTCSKLLCNDCLNDHPNHNLMEIERDGDVGALIKLLTCSIMGDVSKAMKEAAAITENLKTERDENLRKIDEYFTKIRVDLDSYINNVKTKIEQIATRNADNLNESLNKINGQITPILSEIHRLFEEMTQKADNLEEVADCVMKINDLMKDMEEPLDPALDEFYTSLSSQLKQLEKEIGNMGAIVTEPNPKPSGSANGDR